MPQRITESLRGCTDLRVILRNLGEEKKRQNQRHETRKLRPSKPDT